MATKTARRTRRVPTNKVNYMGAEAFADLNEALVGALAFERGKRRNLHVTRIWAPRTSQATLHNDIASKNPNVHKRTLR